ncbi:hypothetical protein KGM_214429 [Danaus plexippus plexippus]|uniref:Uncharacterized protein n=1 Tax=Danaus plexippus plexippus TaxID=278856 RepID=A0A212F060_DANPL|nr:hypothetical protein KGM_214429 [Danaus plexippus plexippus]
MLSRGVKYKLLEDGDGGNVQYVLYIFTSARVPFYIKFFTDGPRVPSRHPQIQYNIPLNEVIALQRLPFIL